MMDIVEVLHKCAAHECTEECPCDDARGCVDDLMRRASHEIKQLREKYEAALQDLKDWSGCWTCAHDTDGICAEAGRDGTRQCNGYRWRGLEGDNETST